MKYRKYFTLALVAGLFLPLLGAESAKMAKPEFDLKSVQFIDLNKETELGFETSKFLPEGFDPYTENVPVGAINYMEEDHIDLGFDTAAYLPEGFDAYKK